MGLMETMTNVLSGLGLMMITQTDFQNAPRSHEYSVHGSRYNLNTRYNTKIHDLSGDHSRPFPR